MDNVVYTDELLKKEAKLSDSMVTHSSEAIARTERFRVEGSELVEKALKEPLRFSSTEDVLAIFNENV